MPRPLQPHRSAGRALPARAAAPDQVASDRAASHAGVSDQGVSDQGASDPGASDPGVRLRPARLERRDLLVALVYAVATLGLHMVSVGGTGLLAQHPEVGRLLSTAFLLVAAASTLWRRGRPVVTLVVAGSISVLEILVLGPLMAYVLLFEALWSPIVHGTRRLAHVATAAGAVISTGFVLLLVGELGLGPGLATGLLVVTVAVITPMMWGWDVRLHRVAQLTAETLAATERALAAERAGRAVEQERREIAQDLHDLVAGHLSAVSLHAGLARSLPDAEGRERSLATTQESARAALRDLRAMIGLLSAADADGAVAAPGTTLSWEVLADRLVVGGDGDRSGEVTIDPAVEDPARTAPAVRAALLRTGAEAVTNALRHGLPPRTLRVSVVPAADGAADAPDRAGRSDARIGPEEVVLISTNTLDPAARSGTGLGLAAIEHRCRALGGTVSAGPDPDRPDRWRLEVRLPAVPGGDLP